MLDAADWHYTHDASNNSILLLCRAGDNVLRLQMVTRDRNDLILEFISIDRRTPQAYRDEMGDLCNRLNDRVAVGFWSVDSSDGEVRCRHAVEVTGVNMTPTFIDNFAKVVLGQVKRHYAAVQAVMDGVSAVRALAMEDS
jgi:hypothetical protein